jgi:hypothetical protein
MNARSLILFGFVVVLLVLGAFRVFRTPRTVNAAEEQAVIATIKLNSGDMGSTEERQRITALEDQLSDAIKRSSTRLRASLMVMSMAVESAPSTCTALVQSDCSRRYYRC